MVRALSTLVLVALALPAGAASELPRHIGMYPQQGAPLAMLDSDVAVHVRGPIVEVTVTQTFRNHTDRVTEATYIFPLPTDAAVSAMKITTGNRTILATIESRAKAVERYEAAVAAGIGAGLLEQDRPDVFTQTVSAIPARGEVVVTLRYDTVAHYQRGTWGLTLPLVIAPRYVPGSADGRPTTGSGQAPNTDRAPDASRVTPGGAPGAGGRTDMRIEFADAVDQVTSSTHELSASNAGYTLVDPKTDHDAVIRWRAKVAQQGWVEAAPSTADGGFAAVLVEAKPAAARKTDLELRLILDRAATTRGDAEAVQRSTVRALLGALTARDRVSVTGSDSFASAAPDATLRSIDGVWGSTAAAFDLTKVLTSLRGSKSALVLITDGLVADDKAALAAAAKVGAPVFVIGVGPAPNHSLLEQLAHTTGGTVRFAIVGDDFTALAKDVIADAASPPAALAVSWGTLAASDIVPAKLPRVGSGQALLVVARVKKVQAANARVRGDVFGFTSVAPGKVPMGATSQRGSLARRWAKLKLDELVAANSPTRVISTHALTYGLVSPLTAMVAIGDEVVLEHGIKHSLSVPVSVPAGMQWQLVKKQTTVETTSTDGRKGAGAKDVKKKARDQVTGGARREDLPSPEGAGAADMEEDTLSIDAAPRATAMAPDRGASDSEDESVEINALASESRRAYRLALSLGAGVALAGGESAALGAFGARIDHGRGRTLVGLDASLWLVDGLNGQGGLFATVARRGIARRVEVGAGAGVRFTGDALGPALQLVLRIRLPLNGLAMFLRYDGALLQTADTSTGQNAFSFGVEARW